MAKGTLVFLHIIAYNHMQIDICFIGSLDKIFDFLTFESENLKIKFKIDCRVVYSYSITVQNNLKHLSPPLT